MRTPRRRRCCEGSLLRSGGSGGVEGEGAAVVGSELVFSDLRHLQEYSLAGMMCLLQQVRPQLSNGDAIWCLLMSNLHVGRASTIKIPILAPAPPNTEGFDPKSSLETVCNSASAVGVPSPPLCRFHGGWGFGNSRVSESAEVVPDIDCLKRFNLSPSMKSLLKRNVAAFATGFRSNSKHLGVVVPEKGTEARNPKNQDSVKFVLGKLRDLNLDENSVPEDPKDEMMIISPVKQIKDLERQQKAIQAARKLSSELTELKLLRMEMEENQRLKKGKQILEETTMKRLSEMEESLRKASGQVDRANAAVRRLGTENAEIKAEMEASKLSASESVRSCLEAAKREKRCLKRLLAWDKQKAKLQGEIAEEKRKIYDLQKELARVEHGSKEAGVKWRQVLKAKELTVAQVVEERRSKEATEANNKQKIKALRLKIEIDSQRHKDDLKRLEQDLSRLKSSTNPPEAAQPKGDTIARLLNQLDLESEIKADRICVLCKKDEVSVVFLPCAHQVICCKCSDGKKGTAACPCCRALIEQKIRVFGTSSC